MAGPVNPQFAPLSDVTVLSYQNTEKFLAQIVINFNQNVLLIVTLVIRLLDQKKDNVALIMSGVVPDNLFVNWLDVGLYRNGNFFKSPKRYIKIQHFLAMSLESTMTRSMRLSSLDLKTNEFLSKKQCITMYSLKFKPTMFQRNRKFEVEIFKGGCGCKILEVASDKKVRLILVWLDLKIPEN